MHCVWMARGNGCQLVCNARLATTEYKLQVFTSSGVASGEKKKR